MAIDPKRVKEVFLEAADVPDEAARAAYLDRACGGDAELRARVEALLRAHDPDGSFLGAPAAVVPDPGHSAMGVSFCLTAGSGAGDGRGHGKALLGRAGKRLSAAVSPLQPHHEADARGQEAACPRHGAGPRAFRRSLASGRPFAA